MNCPKCGSNYIIVGVDGNCLCFNCWHHWKNEQPNNEKQPELTTAEKMIEELAKLGYWCLINITIIPKDWFCCSISKSPLALYKDINCHKDFAETVFEAVQSAYNWAREQNNVKN